MSRKLFEYFFDPEELEPYFSEVVGSYPVSRSSGRPAQESVSSPKAPREVARLDTKRSSVAETAERNTANARSGDDKDPIEEGDQRQQEPTSATRADKVLRTGSEVSTSAEGASEAPSDPIEGKREQRLDSRSRVRNMLSVHSLGQYVYCVRSAILAAERGDVRDIDEAPPRLTFLPNFDRERIEEMLSQKLRHLGMAVLLIVCLMGSMALSAAEQSVSQFNLAALAFLLALLWTAHLLSSIVQLAVRRLAAIRAAAWEPEPSFEGTQPVNWWSMLKSGFEPIRYQRPFQHPELPLEGCPWRVLQKGSVRIPVIRAGGDQLGARRGELYPKHELRLAAYSLLLECDGQHEVPYGLVFPADSPRGLAFAITQEHREQTVKLLLDFERKLAESQLRQNQPSFPENRNRCTNCDYGRPVATSLREVTAARKAGEQIVILQDRAEQVFRCDCGDRFGSAPTHGDSVRKGLRVVLE